MPKQEMRVGEQRGFKQRACVTKRDHELSHSPSLCFDSLNLCSIHASGPLQGRNKWSRNWRFIPVLCTRWFWQSSWSVCRISLESGKEALRHRRLGRGCPVRLWAARLLPSIHDCSIMRSTMSTIWKPSVHHPKCSPWSSAKALY